jgi:hypothetical protein
MSKWIVVVVIADESTSKKGKVEHEIERQDQAAAIIAALEKQLPCDLLPRDQLLVYAEPLEENDVPQIIIDLPRPDRSGPDPYGRTTPKEPPAS